jgi:hypothetical protein
MEGEDSPLGVDIVHHPEDALLHLSGVLGAEDDHFLVSEVDRHTGVGGDSRDTGGGTHLSSVEDMVVDVVGEI